METMYPVKSLCQLSYSSLNCKFSDNNFKILTLWEISSYLSEHQILRNTVLLHGKSTVSFTVVPSNNYS